LDSDLVSDFDSDFESEDFDSDFESEDFASEGVDSLLPESLLPPSLLDSPVVPLEDLCA